MRLYIKPTGWPKMTAQTLRPISALRTIRAFIKNPQDTSKVFQIVNALSGSYLKKGCRRLRKAGGMGVLDKNILDVLTDREWLSGLPDNSFGRAYFDFTAQEGLTAQHLVDTSDALTQGVTDPQEILYARRLRDSHDLWHTLTGYGRDGLGELCVQMFGYPQIKNPGLLLIALAGAVEARKFVGPGTCRALLRALLDGYKASWLPGLSLENFLAQPIDEVRRQLNISEPTRYLLIRPEQPPVAEEGSTTEDTQPTEGAQSVRTEDTQPTEGAQPVRGAQPAPHPGKALSEGLKAIRWTPEDLARAISVPLYQVVEVLESRCDLTADMALRLSKIFNNTTPYFWLGLQVEYDLKLARFKLDEEINGSTQLFKPDFKKPTVH